MWLFQSGISTISKVQEITLSVIYFITVAQPEGATAPGRNSAPSRPPNEITLCTESMESHYFESQSAPPRSPLSPPLPPLATPSFWEVWLLPSFIIIFVQRRSTFSELKYLWQTHIYTSRFLWPARGVTLTHKYYAPVYTHLQIGPPKWRNAHHQILRP